MTKHEKYISGRNIRPMVGHGINMWYEGFDDAMVDLTYLILEFLECEVCYKHFDEYTTDFPPEDVSGQDSWSKYYFLVYIDIQKRNGDEIRSRQDRDEWLITLP